MIHGSNEKICSFYLGQKCARKIFIAFVTLTRSIPGYEILVFAILACQRLPASV